MKRIAVFASGNGSNAQHLAEHFCKSDSGRVVAIYCNNPKAYVIQRAAALNIPLVLFDREKFYAEDAILKDLSCRKVDLIVLAGFLWLMPLKILKAYHHKIINIHPALLPLYGGKGMYGSKVHESVIENNDTESGITIHLVDEMYDKGDILFQTKCPIDKDDTAETLAEKIHNLEYEYYPKVVTNYLSKI
ncbi:MAG: phosphoribosylglycinamide formyltransferase [Omnitrophica WOR_2 bacterium]|jgi:phosphoribosylglycinamide formyltransferase-1